MNPVLCPQCLKRVELRAQAALKEFDTVFARVIASE